MGLFKSLKGDHDDTLGQSAPSGYNTSNTDSEIYPPPPCPPPNRKPAYPGNEEGYAPPQGPPPGHGAYAPPAGPPPSHVRHGDTASDVDPPPYHDWTVIPDNSLLPPPPSIGHETSPSGNADLLNADRAHDWCKAFPLVRPHQPTYQQHVAIANGDVRLMKPPEYKGDLSMPGHGCWKGSTRSKSTDSCLISSSPLYFAAADAPAVASKTIYYELKVRYLGTGRGDDESSIALGYCAMPYPTWRMPGWERGSLAVHGDDGRRYVNDTWGGKDFTSSFLVGDTVGLGMVLSVPDAPPEYGVPQRYSTPIKVDIFFTRNGEKRESWNLHEALDATNDLGVDGLDGQFDLYAAVGTFGQVEFDVIFNRQEWLWRPR